MTISTSHRRDRLVLAAGGGAAEPGASKYIFAGFYKADEHGGITLVDVPGLIDGASEGRGMGIKFLRHIERCRTLIHVVSADSEDRKSVV